MPKLDRRLKVVAQCIRHRVHADIGSDHGHLLAALLASGRIERGIAIENKKQPFENSRATLAGYSADVRFGDGLAGLGAGEADGLSLCGMGGESIAEILQSAPERVPPRVVLQPNRRPERVRQWALRAGFHLVNEQIVFGHWPYQVIVLERAQDGVADDPAYEGLHRNAALLFGPLNLKRRDQRWLARLRDEQHYLQALERLGEEARLRLDAIEHVLRDFKT
ncbi:MAG: tRNA (adenine(22)-N(1))-methyltransferase TrmK [Planctomycetota bacterium]